MATTENEVCGLLGGCNSVAGNYGNLDSMIAFSPLGQTTNNAPNVSSASAQDEGYLSAGYNTLSTGVAALTGGNTSSGNLNWNDTITGQYGALGSLFGFGGTGTAGNQSASTPVGQNSSWWNSFLQPFQEIASLFEILTDIPRMVTIIVGIVFVIVGLAMLGSKPAVQIIGKAKGIAGLAA